MNVRDEITQVIKKANDNQVLEAKLDDFIITNEETSTYSIKFSLNNAIPTTAISVALNLSTVNEGDSEINSIIIENQHETNGNGTVTSTIGLPLFAGENNDYLTEFRTFGEIEFHTLVTAFELITKILKIVNFNKDLADDRYNKTKK